MYQNALVVLVGTRIIWDPTLFLTQNLFGPNMHLKLEFDSGVGPTCYLGFCLSPLRSVPLLLTNQKFSVMGGRWVGV